MIERSTGYFADFRVQQNELQRVDVKFTSGGSV